MSLIELKNITFSYDSSEEIVLDNVCLNIEEGSCTIINGDNGSGKTTLFRILNGLSFPQSGEYIFDGIQVDSKYMNDNKSSKLFHKRVGFLFQNPDVMLFCGSVFDEVAFGPRQMGLSDAEVEARTNECLELFQIDSLKDKAPYHLSGGQKKKVALAAVMALNPEVLILDEPFAGLDKSSCQWLGDFLHQLKEAGKTLIIATHDNEMISELADNITII